MPPTMPCYNLLTGQTLGWTLSNDFILAKDISLTPERVIMRQEPTVTNLKSRICYHISNEKYLYHPCIPDNIDDRACSTPPREHSICREIMNRTKKYYPYIEVFLPTAVIYPNFIPQLMQLINQWLHEYVQTLIGIVRPRYNESQEHILILHA
jgi:hypothetical protein